MTYASSFADPADLKAFQKAKAQGMSDHEAFKHGDNCVGCWSEPTGEGTGPSCALPPDYMEEKWGSVKGAKNKKVLVQRDTGSQLFEVICLLKDRMPRLENCHNQARIDLNPDSCRALGLEPPIMEQVVWSWVDDEKT